MNINSKYSKVIIRTILLLFSRTNIHLPHKFIRLTQEFLYTIGFHLFMHTFSFLRGFGCTPECLLNPSFSLTRIVSHCRKVI